MENSPVKAVIFDMDGLMFNTEQIYDDATKLILAREGHEFTQEVKVAIMGRPGMEAITILRDSYGLKATIEEIEKDISEYFNENVEQQLEMMPGLPELLEKIDQTGLPKALATSSTKDAATRNLSQFGLLDGFNPIMTAENVTNGKPHPEIYLKTCEALKVSPQDAVVFEDSFHGSKSAADSGAFTIAVPTEHSIGCDFSHANLVADSLSDPRISEVLFS